METKYGNQRKVLIPNKALHTVFYIAGISICMVCGVLLFEIIIAEDLNEIFTNVLHDIINVHVVVILSCFYEIIMVKKSNVKQPKVSVLMPVYKTPDNYLRQAIESVLAQTYTDFEFLIIDDCPEKTSEDIVLSYSDKRIIYSKNESNLGISQTRNKLIQMAKGEYLAIMDHDDISLPERFAKEVEFLDSNPDVGVVGTWYERFPDYKLKKRYILNEQIEKDLMYNCSILHTSSMIRKSVLIDNNVKYEEEFSPSEDYALWCSLIGKTKFANIPEVLLKYRDHPSNTSKLQSFKMKEASKKIFAILEKKYPELVKRASKEEVIRFCGLPVAHKKQYGCTYKIKWFGLFKSKGADEIWWQDMSGVPVYIICYNRLSYLQRIIQSLEKHHLYNIHIVDNCSTYPPLLDYLKITPYKVHRMKENLGHMVFFKSDEFKQVRENEYYILTDPDVIPVDECPDDFINYFFSVLQKYPKFTKIGFSLKTNDIPDNNQLSVWVRRWEKQFYRKKLNWFQPYLYASQIDTTFALYRPAKNLIQNNFYKAIRVGYPYEARHLPWYKDLADLNDEDKFYNQTDCGSGNWNSQTSISHIKEELISKNAFNWYENIWSVKKTSRRTVIRILGIKFTINHK